MMHSGFESLGRLRLQAILLLVVVFIVGLLGGVAFERAFGGRQAPRRPMGPPPDGLPPGLSRDLGLTAEQEAGIKAIFERYRPKTDAILDEFVPRLRSATDSARAEVRALLTPAQQEIFDRDRPPEPPELNQKGLAPFDGGPPPGPPRFGDRPPAPAGGRPPERPGGRGPHPPDGPPPHGPPPAERDSLPVPPPHTASPR